MVKVRKTILLAWLPELQVCFKSKEDSKIAKPKIATKIYGFYSINFVESKGESKIAKSKIATKIEGNSWY
jgi:hypothetical protein